MWPFTKTPRRADVTASELKLEFAELRAEVRALQMEWDRTYDKLRGIVARMSRRNGEIGAAEVPAPVKEAASTEPRSPLQAAASRLTRRNY
jgi:hypothetical protein